MRAAVQRMRRADVRRVALDAKILMVARHGEHRRAERADLAREQLVVARRLGLGDAQRVAHEIAGDEQQVRVNRVDERRADAACAATDAGEMCVSDAWTNVNSWPPRSRASGKASGAPRRPRARTDRPRDSRSGVDTKTTPVPGFVMRNAPDASVVTTVSWFDTATPAMPGSPESRTPLPFDVDEHDARYVRDAARRRRASASTSAAKCRTRRVTAARGEGNERPAAPDRAAGNMFVRLRRASVRA